MLRSARKAAGLTQAEVARRMGTTQSVISRSESLDGPDPTIKFLERFALATGQTLAPVIGKAQPRAMHRRAILSESRRLRKLARRLDCQWINVVDPSAWAPSVPPDGLHLVVRKRHREPDGQRQHTVNIIRLGAERAFGRAVDVIDLDSVAGVQERTRIFRGRRNLRPDLIAQAPAP